MDENINQEEYAILDFDKLWRIIWHRRYWSLACYVIIVLFAIFYTSQMEKSYTSKATILINTSNSTNLGDINPFILANVDSSNSNLLQSLTSGGNTVDTELVILKSPLVLDKIIQKNDLRYEIGKRKGEYIDADFFLKYSGLEVNQIDHSNLIEIVFHSGSPKKSYDIVNSVIEAYQSVSEEINSSKAKKDKLFLENEIKNTKDQILKCADQLEQYKKENGFLDFNFTAQQLLSKNPYHKRIASQLKNLPEFERKARELKFKLEMYQEKYKMLQKKYEWISLIEHISNKVTNITVLSKPRLKKDFEKSAPSLKYNLIFAIAISIIISSLFVIGLEKFDPQLTYLSVNSKYLNWFNKKISNQNLSMLIINLKERYNKLNSKKIDIITFNLDEKDVEIIKTKFKVLLNSINDYQFHAFDESTNPITIIDTISNSSSVLLIGKIGKSNKSLFVKAELLAQSNNNIVSEVIITS